jgi:UDP-N-acetylglucosamine 2-epimerase (non-hydrolysing)
MPTFGPQFPSGSAESPLAKIQKILVVYGTRPEAIKMAPIIKAIDQSATLRAAVAVTGQHRAMRDQVNSLWQSRADLNIISQRQTLEEITARVLSGLSAVIEAERPAAVLVQGDTTTCFAAALAAFYNAVPVIHLEAGLRTGNARDPFPEEMNRRLTSQLATVHLAATAIAKATCWRMELLGSIYVTGNTVVDALLITSHKTTR